MEQITLENVSKKYEGKLVLEQISHTVSSGQSIAYMGHNGCGKSTLLKIMAGLVTPTSGKVVSRKSLLFHYVPEKFLPIPFTGRSYLRRMGELDGLGRKQIDERLEGLAGDFFLEELLDVPMKSLSKGSLQKIGVIQALMKTPEVLLLDEPLSGQDAASQEVFIHKINGLRSQGVTILMSCHEQSLVDAIAETTYTIRDRKLVLFQPQKEKVYTLILENSNNRPVPEGMERYGTGFRMPVGEKEVQGQLLMLLQQGWELRGMYDEKSN